MAHRVLIAAILLVASAAVITSTTGAAVPSMAMRADNCAVLKAVAWTGVVVTRGVCKCSQLGYGGPISCYSDGQVASLYLPSRGIKGRLPASFGKLTAMYDLKLHNNSLSGTLPPEWSSLTKLQSLNVGDNKITGTLPRQWANMQGLYWLTLKKNSITGTLPRQWSKMRLYALDVEGNGISGTLPPEWGSLKDIFSMILTNNKRLTGTIPAQWINYKSSTKLLMSIGGTAICGPPLPKSSHVRILGPLPKCKPACKKAPLTRSYTFTVTNSAPTWSAARNTLKAALLKVYKNYSTPYPPATKLSGPAGQRASKTKRTTWRFTATLSIAAKNQCKPRGDAMHAALRKALAIPGSSIKA